MRFRYRKTGDVLVLMDTVFFRIVDTHSVAGYPYRMVAGVQSRWSHAPYDPKQKWVRWVDSIDFVKGKTLPVANQPILTLIDSMAIDSIAPAVPRDLYSWTLKITAVERSGRSWSFDALDHPDAIRPINRGRGIALPPGTTFRIQGFSASGPGPTRFQTLHVWSQGKVIDSLEAFHTPIPYGEGVRRATLGTSSTAATFYDARGRRDRESAGVGQGADILTGAKSLEIRFGN